MPLTQLQLKNAKPKAKTYRLYDSGGLLIEIRPNGGKYWRWKYYYQKKEKRMALGVFPEVGLKDARLARDKAKLQLANGEDPITKKKDQKQRDIQLVEQSFTAIAHEWFIKNFTTKDKDYANRVWRSLEKDIFPIIGDRPIDMVTAGQLRQAFKNIEERNAMDMAHRVLSRCRSIFEYANAMEYTKNEPTRGIKGTLMFHKAEHFAYLKDPKDIGALMRAIHSYESLSTKLGLLLCAYTFVRHSNIRKAEWKEFDLDNAMWKIPAEKMKMRKPHLVPLSHQVIKIIEQLHTVTYNSPYLFPKRTNNNEPMSNNTLLSALRRLDYSKEEMTVHGFRHIASTLLNESSIWNKDAIEVQLAHTDNDKIRGTYNHADYLDERKRMMQWWADYLDELKSSAEIIPIANFRRG